MRLIYTIVYDDCGVCAVTMGSLLLTWTNFDPTWISNHLPSKVRDEFTNPFPNFNGATVDVWVWKSNFIPHFLMDVITHPCFLMCLSVYDGRFWNLYQRQALLDNIHQGFYDASVHCSRDKDRKTKFIDINLSRLNRNIGHNSFVKCKCTCVHSDGPLLLTRFIWTNVGIRAWISNYIHIKQCPNKIWWLCLVPTSTTRFASDV